MSGGGPRPGQRFPGDDRRGHQDLVVVTHRLPFQPCRRPDGSITWSPRDGQVLGDQVLGDEVLGEPGLVMGRPGTWVGWSGTTQEDAEDGVSGDVRLVPVPLSAADISGYQEGMADATLWPLYHDVIAPPQFHRPWWDTYVRVNRRFALAAARHAAPGAMVWVHDHHLQLVPQTLRQLRPDLRIAFFNHVPFPPYELFAQLPWRRQVLDGLLGADLLGFQRPADAENFLNAAGRCGLSTERTASLPGPQIGCVATFEGSRARTVRVAALPTSVDARALEALARERATIERARAIRREMGSPDVLLLGVDRLDHSAGILHRLKAVGELYAEGGFDARGATLAQVVLPRPDRDGHFPGLRGEIGASVARINGRHADLGRPAVHYLYQPMARRERASLYLAADVLLVTALRDGMNLVAKEFVASRHDERGALVLSEFAGASLALPQAFVVNPHDVEGLKGSILREHVFRHDVGSWAAGCLAALGPGRRPAPFGIDRRGGGDGRRLGTSAADIAEIA